MPYIKSLNGNTPIITPDCFIAETAVIIGNVTLGSQCSVWFNTVLRGDVCKIKVGNRVNIQDNVCVHGTFGKADTIIGNDVSIGHNAIVHGCTIHDKVLIGMGSIIMDNCILETTSIIAAGAVVTQNTQIKKGELWAGIPAKKIGEVSLDLQQNQIERIAHNYLKYSQWYKNTAP